MNCRYEFSVSRPSDRIALAIRQLHDERPILNASFVGKRQPLTTRSLGLALVKFPFNSMKVIVGIHWEAMKLWLKGVKLVDRPSKTTAEPLPRTPVIKHISGELND